MPRKEKINLAKVLASLNTVCSKCGFSISPDKIMRVDSERIECPACRERFTPNGTRAQRLKGRTSLRDKKQRTDDRH